MWDDAYERLAQHLSVLGMGYPVRDDLLEILRENLTRAEAELLLAVPTRVAPLTPSSVEEIAYHAPLSRPELDRALENLADRGLLYAGPTPEGETGYALLQVGFGFPQTFFWRGEDTPHARHMAGLVAKYFNRHVTREAYSGSETKPYRYVPVERSLDRQRQTVQPYHVMEEIVRGARSFAVGHCPCRVAVALKGRDCGHPQEVCLKFDEMADYVVDRGLARAVDREEALDIVRRSEEAGLVHFVDNVAGRVQHNCNCCGCACWNVGSIRRRKIPRDVLMATYFLRETDRDACTGCGACEEVCPVRAVGMERGWPATDQDWCIGCGVCATRCPTDAVRLVPRRGGAPEPVVDFQTLHQRILEEKGLR